MTEQKIFRVKRTKSKIYGILGLSIILHIAVCGFASCVFAEDAAQASGEAPSGQPLEERSVGVFYDVQVPEQNYNFIRSVIAVFGNKFGKQPKTEEEIDEAVWDQLLMSFEAFRRGVQVGQEEVDAEVDKIMAAEKAQFDRKADRPAYEAWLKEKTNESPELFENQIRHMIQLQRLKEEVMQGLDPEVTEDDMKRGFLNENSSIDLELLRFDDEKAALEFYRKVAADPGAWDREKEKRPDEFKRPGGVTCQFLVDFWVIPEGALQEMVKKKPGEFHGPETVYKGWAVFKVIGSTAADEMKFEEVKERYRDKVKAGKRFEGYNEWFKKLKEEANIRKERINKEAQDGKEDTGS